MSKTKYQLQKEVKELRQFLREIKKMPEQGDFDCGLRIDCPVINCGICMATQALKRKRPKLDKWRLM